MSVSEIFEITVTKDGLLFEKYDILGKESDNWKFKLPYNLKQVQNKDEKLNLIRKLAICITEMNEEKILEMRDKVSKE